MKRLVASPGYTAVRSPRWPLLLSLGVTLFAPGPVIGQDDPAAESRSQPDLLWHQASALFPIRVHLPNDFDSAQAYPAVIALHGFGGSSERFERIGRAFSQAGFIAVLPEAPYPLPSADSARHSTWELSTWTEEYGLGPPLTDDPAVEALSGSLTVDEFFPSVIDRIREQYRVGPIYVFGFSLGGVFALVNGFHNRDQVDGIIAFGATYYRELFTARGDRLEDGNHLRIRLVLGRSDPMVPFSNAEQARDAFQAAGYAVVLDEFDGGHTVPDDALRRAVNWLSDLAIGPADEVMQGRAPQVDTVAILQVAFEYQFAETPLDSVALDIETETTAFGVGEDVLAQLAKRVGIPTARYSEVLFCDQQPRPLRRCHLDGLQQLLRVRLRSLHEGDRAEVWVSSLHEWRDGSVDVGGCALTLKYRDEQWVVAGRGQCWAS